MFSPALATAYTIAVSLLPSPMKSTALLTLACLSALPAVVLAQEAEPRNRVVIVENVKFDYAQVLNVEPVFQTLRATRTEEHCEPVSTRTLAPVNVTGEEPVEDKAGSAASGTRCARCSSAATKAVEEPGTPARQHWPDADPRLPHRAGGA